MAAAADRGREREIAAFDKGDLWCSDEADPPLNPSGWYFRPRRGSPQLWIGPFPDQEGATCATFSGDALRDARRYLDHWRRGEPAPARPKLVLAAAQPEKSDTCIGSQFELALDGGDATPVELRSRRRRRVAGAPAPAQLAFTLPS